MCCIRHTCPLKDNHGFNGTGSSPLSSVLHAGLYILHLFTYVHAYINAVTYVPSNFIPISNDYTTMPCLEIDKRRRVAGFLKIAFVQVAYTHQLKTDSKIIYSLVVPWVFIMYSYLLRACSQIRETKPDNNQCIQELGWIYSRIHYTNVNK